ncbi:Sensor histidine kinase YycG [Frondihabitans sp. 762G35]|uniref:sensor histidine kinase n=1 Tax=Frondihabitans sp. 762G35 TaxID=1446794 RepID=UPI000D205D51|nr:HAMP domain-containing sensor histidine kinase [Frondihabitans sp. 762G35]ARC56181.1 Sensor histidine kinase YycG [Frondihabitans sp. 762G35]
MAPADYLVVSLLALGTALVVGALALVALKLLSRASLVVQVAAVAVAAVVSLIGGMLLAAEFMYVSSHDLEVFLWLALSSGAVSVVLALLLGRSLVGNSRLLIARARRVGEESSGHPAPLAPERHVANEFATLARELAASDERLALSREREARTETARRELVAWISHDLRTPLAGLRAMAEALEDGLVDDPDRYHRQMRAQVDRLGGMIDDLFQLSTIHSGNLRLTLRRVRVSDLVDDLVVELGPIATARGVHLVARDVADETIVADPDELARAVANLAMNSIRLSPPGSEITLSAEAAPGDLVLLSVADSAGGILETDLARVFEPGWRAGEARTPLADGSAGGAGLGLAIVQGIVEAHRGHVSVRNVDGGCRFDVALPRS